MLKGYTTTGKIILAALAALFVLAAIMGIYAAIRAKPKAEAKLRGNQVEAVQSSASDAVNTIGQTGANEDAINGKVSDAQGHIHAATDAAAADAAGRDGLCGISGDLCDD